MVIRRGERRERKLKLFAIEMQSRGSGAISSRFVGDKAAEEPRTMSRLRAEPGPEHAGLSLEPSIRSPAVVVDVIDPGGSQDSSRQRRRRRGDWQVEVAAHQIAAKSFSFSISHSAFVQCSGEISAKCFDFSLRATLILVQAPPTMQNEAIVLRSSSSYHARKFTIFPPPSASEYFIEARSSIGKAFREFITTSSL